MTEEPRTTSAMISDAVGVGTNPCKFSFKYVVSAILYVLLLIS